MNKQRINNKQTMLLHSPLWGAGGLIPLGGGGAYPFGGRGGLTF